VLEGSEDVGGSAAGGYAYERVLAGETCGGEVGCALLGGVFGLLAGFAEGGVAAGDEALHESWGDGECGRNFAGVEDAETAAGAGSDVEETAAIVDAACDFVDGFGYVGEDGGYGRSDFGVFVVDEAEHVEGGELVDVLGEWVAGFGEEGGEVHGESMIRAKTKADSHSGNDKQRTKTKCGSLSTAQWTMKQSIATVEMTHLLWSIERIRGG
jgi:hypothetical protein